MMPLPRVFSSGMKAIISNWPPDKLEAFDERIAIIQYGCDIPSLLAEELAFARYASITERAELVKMDHAAEMAWQNRYNNKTSLHTMEAIDVNQPK